MKLLFDPESVEDYQRFLAVRSLSSCAFSGTAAVIPDEDAARIGLSDVHVTNEDAVDVHPDAYDYQAAIIRKSIAKRKYAIFADCGLGKTLMILSFARYALRHSGGKVLIVSPLMVCRQTRQEYRQFFGSDDIRLLSAQSLQGWLVDGGSGIGIVNYEAIRDGLLRGGLTALILDESSMLKSHYGKWGQRLIELGHGLLWKLCATGTPAPNDRIEYANHAIFLDRFSSVNGFLATYFVNRGQTDNRWELKPHAMRPFYKSLSEWCIFLKDPSTYGWKDNVATTPPIRVHVDHIELTDQQRKATQDLTGSLFVNEIGGITKRSKLSRIAKGLNGETSAKAAYIVDLAQRVAPESVIIWCRFNAEQDELARMMPEAVSISGDTSSDQREERMARFINREARILITKPKILGFGLNLQVCTRQIFSGIGDSYEEYYQAVKRSNRIGSTKPLDVHIPVTELEVPFVTNVMRKAHLVEQDTRVQEQLFRECMYESVR